MAKTKPTPRRMRRRNPQAIRTPARGSTVIITTTPDDITAGTVDITPAGTAGNGAALWVCSRALPREGQGSFLLLWLCDVWWAALIGAQAAATVGKTFRISSIDNFLRAAGT